MSLRRPSIRVMGRTKMTFWSLCVAAATNSRMGRLRAHRRNLADQKDGLHHGPAISPAMKAAAQAMKAAAQARHRTEARRRRQEKAKAARARGRPPD